PPRDAISNVDGAQFKASLRKIDPQDGYPDTEMLCFLNEKICSGEVYRHEDWLDNVNPAFFGSQHGTTANSAFDKNLIHDSVGTIHGKPLYAGDISLTRKELLAGSSVDPI